MTNSDAAAAAAEHGQDLSRTRQNHRAAIGSGMACAFLSGMGHGLRNGTRLIREEPLRASSKGDHIRCVCRVDHACAGHGSERVLLASWSHRAGVVARPCSPHTVPHLHQTQVQRPRTRTQITDHSHTDTALPTTFYHVARSSLFASSTPCTYMWGVGASISI